ncbi:CD0519/CD1768 family membrane protein [Haloplasma contractile]|nr:hypothetical protein [Haloplasma contractile]
MERSRINDIRLKRVVSVEGYLTLVIIFLFFMYLSYEMGEAKHILDYTSIINGSVNMFNTMMQTAHHLLLNTVFFIMGIAVLTGAFSALLSEFGVVSLINKGLSIVMKPLYNMPGASAIGILTTYLSDNPAVISLAKDKGFRRYFKRYQLPALTNLGTAFGMGLVVTTYMIAKSTLSNEGNNFIAAALIGNVGAIIGSIISVRLMLFFTKRKYGTKEGMESTGNVEYNVLKHREIREGSFIERALDSILEGGKSGVELGIAIIPGVVIISTLVLILTNGPTEIRPGYFEYTGAAFEGVGLLPYVAEKIEFILQPLFGFKSPQAIAFPITALGSVGAALALIPKLLSENLIGANDIAVFTAMGMCFSGYLSTHVAMMDGLNSRELTGKAILSHTIGGIMAGISAHFIFEFVMQIG